MFKAKDILNELGYELQTSTFDLKGSDKRFSDGSHYRFEIPSMESPLLLKQLFEELKTNHLYVHRVSQGSGIMLLKTSEIIEMCRLANENNTELSLFVGPRGTWDLNVGPLTPSGKGQGWRNEGLTQIMYALEDILHGVEQGLRGILVADEGLLAICKDLKAKGHLPMDLMIKISAQLMVTNPVTAKMLQDLGANSLNLPSSLSIEKMYEIRQVVDIPFDIYIESPDSLGGFKRYYEIPEIIRLLSPVYIKMGLSNHPELYPHGKHLDALNSSIVSERVRRLKIAVETIERYCPHFITYPLNEKELGIPLAQEKEVVNKN